MIESLKKDLEKYASDYQCVSDENIRLEKMLHEMKGRLEGERKCDKYCQKCTHGFQDATENNMTVFLCDYDSKCRYFARRSDFMSDFMVRQSDIAKFL